MNNIYIDLDLPIDGADTNPSTLLDDIKKRVDYWQRGLAQFPEYQTHLNNAQKYVQQIRQGSINLSQQAEEARRIQLQNLQQYVLETKNSGGNITTAKQTAKVNFRGLSDETYDWVFDNTSLEPIADGYTYSNEFKNVFAAVTPDNWGRYLKIGGVLLIALLVIVTGYSCVVSPIFRGVSSIVSSGGSSPDLVRYPNRDYSKAEWKNLIGDAHHNDYFFAITTDKNHFAAGNYSGIAYFDNGNWTPIPLPPNTRISHIFHDVFITNNNEIGTLDLKHWSMKKLPENFRAERVMEFEKGVFYAGSENHPNQGVIYSGDKVTELKENDKRLFIWNGQQNLGSIFGINVYRTYKNGAAIGWNSGQLVKYTTRTGWTPHLETTHRGEVFYIWAVDENNFVIVGDGIAIYKNGKETHPIINIPEFPPNAPFRPQSCLAVWGTDIDHFWVIDVVGNIVEYKNDKFVKAKAGPDTNWNILVWISPEGAVIYGGIYRLD